MFHKKSELLSSFAIEFKYNNIRSKNITQLGA